MHITSSQNQPVSSLVQWTLKDSTGQQFNEDIFFSGGPDGTVARGAKIRGSIAYETPKNVYNFVFQFVPDIGSTDLAEWNISI